MNILFPVSETIGLQAKRVLDCSEGNFYTLVTTNQKGGVTSVKSFTSKEIEDLHIDVVVSSSKIDTFKNAKIVIDESSHNVDTALVKVLKEELFRESA